MNFAKIGLCFFVGSLIAANWDENRIETWQDWINAERIDRGKLVAELSRPFEPSKLEEKILFRRKVFLVIDTLAKDLPADHRRKKIRPIILGWLEGDLKR